MVTRIKNNTVTTTQAPIKATTNPNEELAAMVRRLQAENEALKKAATAKASEATRLKVSEKGAVSIYGMGRFPMTVYPFTKDGAFEGSQAHKLCLIASSGDYKQSELYKFIVANAAELRKRQQASLAAKANAAEADSDL